MSRLPELERELVATAARLRDGPRRFERRARNLVPAVALACLVAVALVAGGLLDADDDGLRGGGSSTVSGVGFGADATLEDMLGIFRRPQTAADDMGVTKEQLDEIPDRQPGEDFTQSRRVEWPGARIFVWPMRDGVCYGVAGGSGCSPLGLLRREGVSIGTGDTRGRGFVYGMVVDGIREVVVTAKGGPELRVPVRENFFFVDVNAAARVDRVRWRYAGQDQSFDIESSFPDLPPEPDPDAGLNAVPRSFSEPDRFTAGGVSYSAVGYQATGDTICVRVSDPQTARPSLACQGIRGLRDRLAEQPAELFAGGGTPHGLMKHTGFARSDVVDAEAVERTSETTIVLSEPWSPAPWEGEPIRFLLVFGPPPGETGPRHFALPPLRVRLADGRTVTLPD